MAVAAASLPRPAQYSSHQQHEECDEKVNGANGAPPAKVLINPIAAYSQQLADKQLHIARVTDDGVHWRRREVAEGAADTPASKRESGYFKDKLLGKFTNKASDTALSGGMLDREFSDNEYRAAAARLDVGDTSRLDDGHSRGARVPEENACMHPAAVRSRVNGHHSDTAPKQNGNIVEPSDKSLQSGMPLPSPAESSTSTADSHAYSSETPSTYATPTALAPMPSPLMCNHTPVDALATLDESPRQEVSQGTIDEHTNSQGDLVENSLPGASTDGPALASDRVDVPNPPLYIKPSTTLSRQQQDKKTPPPLSSLQFLPQANVIPPTPPTASTSASFSAQASTSAVAIETQASQSGQAQFVTVPGTQQAPASPKSPRTPSSPSSSSQTPLYLSPESIRKTSPSHRRSQSYQPTSAPARTSASSTGTTGSMAPLATPSLGGSQPARRSSLLPPIMTSPALNNASSDLRKRSYSPRRALSFRGSGSGTALPTPGGLLYDEPLSMEEQAEQQRQANQLDETIARQAEQIRKERLSKRIETQRAHEKALASLREEEEARKGRGEDTGASALISGSPPGRDGLPSPMASAAAKGKERERGDTTSTTHTGQGSPTSPVSVHKQLWSSSPVAGEKAVLRADNLASEKTGYAKEKVEAAEPERVLVGNLIGEDHVNYVLMYNMLTGIRIGVSSLPLYDTCLV